MISVYITSYNKSNFIAEAIESVLSQTLRPNEIIIIDDSSTDNSREIIDGYKSRYPEIITILLNDKNLGITASRNIALKKCSGDFITFLDADDFFYPKKLELEFSLLKNNNNIQVAYSNFNYIDINNRVVGTFSSDNDILAEGNIFPQTFTKQYGASSGNNYIYEMYYKNCSDKIGYYDEKIKIWEDWDFRIRMSKIFNYGYCPEINSVYRKLNSGLHKSDFNIHYREQVKIIEKNKFLLNDLSKNDQKHIKNRIYAKIKVYFIFHLKKIVQQKKYFYLFLEILHFYMNFRQKKIFSFIYEELKKKK